MFFDSGTVLVRTVVVGTLAYLALVALLRLAGKRTLSKWNAFDLVVTVAFGSTLATALLSKDTSLAQGVVAFALLVGLQWVITRLSVRYGVFQRWVKAEPRLLSLRGQLRHDALRAERVSESEVRAAVRAHGSTALEDIEAVVLETDGTFSVIGQRGSSASAMSDVQGYCQ
ncbi:hypothetical protein LYB30171_01759 [Lysobacter luteus]|uniref:DUF421 domain-containing protein n=2 Tax=Novilysobacter luteus TaxID=2822368 RepID=A0ABM8UGE9_9GAMM|nr:hypothetical protein LYB30171_01759 [Lysobacter luteus]